MFKILIVISEEPPITSGVSRITVRLQRGLQARGHQVDILSLQHFPRYVRGEFRLSSMLWRAPKAFLPKLDGYDIVHIHGPAPTFSDMALLLTVARKNPRGPRIIYTHLAEIDLPDYKFLSLLYTTLHKRLAHMADQIIVSTPAYARNLAHHVRAEHIAIVPWGIDSAWRPEAAPKAERFTILFVGQLRPYKGLSTLLKAVENVRDSDVHIIGTGYMEHEYKAYAARKNLDHVVFHGRKSDQDVRAAYSHAHVLVLPSNTRAEAFGIVSIEAMAAGCVPIVSQLPGLTDVVGDAGLSFPVGDADALAALLVRLRDDSSLYEGYSNRARVRSEYYTWERTIAEHEALYAQVDILGRFESGLQGSSALTDALARLLQDTVTRLGASSGSLMLVEPGTRMLRVCATFGQTTLDQQQGGQPIGEGVSGLAAAHNIAVLVPEGLEALTGDALTRRENRPHIESALVAPLSGGSSVFGVLNVSRYVPNHRFEAEDLHWTRSLAQRAGFLLTQYVRRGAVGLWQQS